MVPEVARRMVSGGPPVVESLFHSNERQQSLGRESSARGNQNWWFLYPEVGQKEARQGNIFPNRINSTVSR
jgi:hypothetical protein